MNEYYVIIDGDDQGPFTINQLRSMWTAGKLNQKMKYSQPGMSEWQPLSNIIDLLEPQIPRSPSGWTPSPPPSSNPTGTMLVKSAKSRGVYIILGLFFGLFGVHNFYAGHLKNGVAQLVVLFTLGWLLIGIFIVAVWVLIELFTVTVDGQGDPMT
jgi:TM2 domain-containing membrane protein YozV